jgi:hypothetical protein
LLAVASLPLTVVVREDTVESIAAIFAATLDVAPLAVTRSPPIALTSSANSSWYPECTSGVAGLASVIPVSNVGVALGYCAGIRLLQSEDR